MRVLQVIETLGRGGAEQALINLLPALRQVGIECELAVLKRDDTPDAHSHTITLRQQNFPVFSLDSWPDSPQSLLRATRRLAQLARRRHIKVLHSHLINADLVTGLSRFLNASPRRVVSLHNTDFDFLLQQGANPISSRLWPFLLRNNFHFASAVSTPVKEHYARFVPGKSIAITYNGICVSSQNQSEAGKIAVRARWNVQPQEFLIVVAARLVPEKGHKYLLQALHTLQQRQTMPRVLLFGEGSLRGELQQQIVDLNLSRVSLQDNVPHEQLMPILAAADAFILPSIREGMGLAPAEAMALGVPVITTSAGGLVDVVEHEKSGLLVPPANSDALAAAIQRLMNDLQLRQTLVLGGYERVQTRFNVHEIALQWQQHYASLF